MKLSRDRAPVDLALAVLWECELAERVRNLEGPVDDYHWRFELECELSIEDGAGQRVQRLAA